MNACPRNTTVITALCAVLCGLLGTACNESVPEPEIASSAPLASYAQGYPDAVEATVTTFGEAEVTSKDVAAGYREYPDAYKEEVDYALVADALERADLVGRSYAYVERLEEVQAVRKFYDEEKDELRRKVAGAAQHMAKEAGCEADVGGAAAVTLDKTMKERLEKRLREGNDAHRLVERYRESLGKKNAATLEKQIDEVALASYLVNIEMVEMKVRLQRIVEEADEVKDTADELIAEEQSYQNEPGRTDEEKQAASERIEAMKTAKSRVDTAVRNASKTLETMEQRIDKAQQGHDDALAKILKGLRDRAASK